MEISTNKFRLLIVLVIVLLTLNITTIVSLLYHTQQDKKQVSRGRDSGQTEAIAEQGARFFGEELNLDPGQTDKFREINSEYNHTINYIAADLEKMRRDMVNEMAGESPDKNKLQAISREIGVKHEEMKNTTIDYYLKMKAVCNKEQQERLYTLFLEKVQKDVPGEAHSGQGKGHRWRWGRNRP